MDKKYFRYLPLILIIFLILLWINDILNPKLTKNIPKSVKTNNYKISNISKNIPKSVNTNNYEISGIFKAIDGDSLRMENGQEIRLLKIDAPEYRQICFDKNDKEYDCGKISAKFLRKLTLNTKLICKYNEKDIYDRYLAICYDNNKNINYEMIKSGMAIIYNIHDASEELKFLEKQARESNIGLWQGKFLAPKAFRSLKVN